MRLADILYSTACNIYIAVCLHSTAIVQTSFCSPEKLISQDLVAYYSQGLSGIPYLAVVVANSFSVCRVNVGSVIGLHDNQYQQHQQPSACCRRLSLHPHPYPRDNPRATSAVKGWTDSQSVNEMRARPHSSSTWRTNAKLYEDIKKK